MRPSYHLLLAACAALCLAAPARADSIFLDPVGDTFGAGAVFPDIIGVSVVNSGVSSFTLTVSYAGAISAPSAFAANSVVGYIDLDTDQNAATGGTDPWGGPVAGGNNWINFFIGGGLVPGPTIGLGDEYYLDLFSEESHAGTVDIVRTSDSAIVGTGTITFAATFFDVFVSLSDLGGDDGAFNYGVLTGTSTAPTDRAPNGDSPYVNPNGVAVIPAPPALVLMGVGAGCLLGYRRRAGKRTAA